MSNNEILDAYGALRRALALTRASVLKDQEIGHIQLVIVNSLAEGPQSMGELADWCLADKASITRAVSSLEKSGFVKRKEHESDRRVTLIELSAKGRTLAKQTLAIRSEIGKKIAATLSGDERKEFKRLLAKVADGLNSGRN